jgi:O-antigen/teichoic acid export membrane protein
MTTASRTGSSMIWALLESGGLSILSLVTLLVLARLIGPTELGIAALALGAVQIPIIVVELLLHDAIVQRRDLDEGHLSTAFWTCLGLGIGLYGGCVIGAEPFAAVFAQPELAEVLPIAGVSIVLSGLGCVPIAILRRNSNFRPLAVRSLYGRLGGAVIGIGLAIYGYGVWSLIFQQLFQIFLNTLLVWPMSHWRPTLTFSFRRLGQLLAFGVFAVGSRIIWVFTVRLFTLLCGYFFGVAAAGYLNIAQRVVDTLYDLLAGAAYNVSLPLFSRLQDDQSALMRAYRQAIEMTALSAFPVFTGIAVCAPSIISIFLGDPWLPAVPLVRLLALVAVCQFLFIFAHIAQTAAGRPGSVFVVTLIGSVAVFGALFLFRPTDIFGATVVWVSRVLLVGPVALWLVYRNFGLAAVAPFKGALWPLLAAILMAVVLIFLDRVALGPLSEPLALIVTVVIGSVIYIGIVALTSRAAVQQWIALVMGGMRGLRAS